MVGRPLVHAGTASGTVAGARSTGCTQALPRAANCTPRTTPGRLWPRATITWAPLWRLRVLVLVVLVLLRVQQQQLLLELAATTAAAAGLVVVVVRPLWVAAVEAAVALAATCGASYSRTEKSSGASQRIVCCRELRLLLLLLLLRCSCVCLLLRVVGCLCWKMEGSLSVSLCLSVSPSLSVFLSLFVSLPFASLDRDGDRDRDPHAGLVWTSCVLSCPVALPRTQTHAHIALRCPDHALAYSLPHFSFPLQTLRIHTHT